MPPGDRVRDLEIDDDLTAAPSGPPRQYIDLDTLKNADGIIAIISQRRSNGVLTFAIFKEFERDRRIERTSFVASSLMDSYLQMAKLVAHRIEEIEGDAKLLASLQKAAGYTPERRNVSYSNGGRK